MPKDSASHNRCTAACACAAAACSLLFLPAAAAGAAGVAAYLASAVAHAASLGSAAARHGFWWELCLGGAGCSLFTAGLVWRANRRRGAQVSSELTEKNRALLLELGRHCLVRQELENARSFLQGILDALTEPVVVIGFDHRVVALNRAARSLAGQEGGEGGFCYQVLHGLERPCPAHPGRSFCGLEELGESLEARTVCGEHEWGTPDGGRRWHEVTATIFSAGDGSRRFVLESLHDITRRKEAEESARLLADFDPLTGLPNRRLFNDRLTLALVQAHRRKEKVALLFLDLDRFKVINDTLGHAVGDLLLQEVARRLRQCCRREEDTIARQGGDEFVVILTEISDVSAAARIAQEVVDTFCDPFHLGGQELFVSSSIGISVYPDDGDNADRLVRNADAALYFAKENGKNGYKIYNPELNRKAMERLKLENAIRRALKENEFVLYYQPKVNVKTSRIVCLEALIRWNHPEFGLLLPADFIALAEETGSIVPLGEWVLHTACRQNRRWQLAGLPPVRVAVNVSERQFLKPNLVDSVESALGEVGLEGRWLDLEVSLQLLMRSGEESLRTLKRLAALGVHISVANIGKGYSSLSYLRRLPVHTLKVDRSCIGEIEQNPEFAAAFVHLARSIDLEVIHEGVETVEQLSFFRSIACDEMQGNLFSRPVPSEEVAQILSRNCAVTTAPPRRSRHGDDEAGAAVLPVQTLPE